MVSFTLRPFRITDLPSLVKHANDADIARNLMDNFPHPFTEEAGTHFIEHVAAGDPPLIMAIEVAGEVRGAIGLHPQNDVYRHNAELGYWLARAHWGQGIMTGAVKAAVDRAFATFPTIHRIYARPFGSNAASQRVLEKAGFTLEATLQGTLVKHGRVEDELIYAVRR